ncbi:sensor histidine kinase [Streptomyces sp. NPDC052396]|uniref:sensor histidine kinase n=1 Tax=Streptomyces sp. NPDC052396 TaxID=3365689 RepID=UPI0037D4BC47
MAHPDAPPALRIQLSALQALCRQVFGFRLAMIALATPFALHAVQRGWPTWPIAGAVLCTATGTCVLIRDWERFGPLLLRHPALLGLDTLAGALLLFAAGPDSPLAYATLCTPLLAGLVYGWRGAGFFAGLTLLIVALAYLGSRHPEVTLAGSTLLPGVCVLAGAVGVTLRGLVLRFGAASEALTETRSRLAVNEAVEAERARLAREMHDSVAKTLHGLALAAEGLARSTDRLDRQQTRTQAELVARAARRAAAESRELLAGLRRESGMDGGVTLGAELAGCLADFTRRTGLPVACHTPPPAAPPVPRPIAAHIVAIVAEALENAHRHAGAGRLEVSAEATDGWLRVLVRDDGRGLPPALTLDDLRRTRHFGLLGMVERAARIGARIRMGKGRSSGQGTEVRLELPLAALGPAPPAAPYSAPSSAPYSAPCSGSPSAPSGSSAPSAPSAPFAPSDDRRPHHAAPAPRPGGG